MAEGTEMGANMDVKDIVKRYLDEWTPEKFCQTVFAVDNLGNPVSESSPEAVKFCFYGFAYRNFAYSMDGTPGRPSFDRLENLVQNKAQHDTGIKYLADVNDLPDGYEKLTQYLREIYEEE